MRIPQFLSSSVPLFVFCAVYRGEEGKKYFTIIYNIIILYIIVTIFLVKISQEGVIGRNITEELRN